MIVIAYIQNHGGEQSNCSFSTAFFFESTRLSGYLRKICDRGVGLKGCGSLLPITKNLRFCFWAFCSGEVFT